METLFKRHGPAILALIIVILISLLLQTVISGTTFQQDRLAVWVFDVGQGDAIFIDGPEKQILIDGGPNGIVLEKLTSVIPFWDRSIDVIINTHPHADHVTGLNYVLDRYEIEEVWVSGQNYGTDVFAEFESLKTPRLVSSGYEIDLGAGAVLTVLWPEYDLDGQRLDDPNDGSVVTLVTYGDTTILLTGDIGVDEEEQLLDHLPRIDVLKVGHQGSITSSSPDFLDVIDPRYAIITVGENDYGHPSPIVLDRLESTGAIILRTDQDGDIRILSDGGEPEVTTFDL